MTMIDDEMEKSVVAVKRKLFFFGEIGFPLDPEEARKFNKISCC